jgi:hypothetical protein
VRGRRVWIPVAVLVVAVAGIAFLFGPGDRVDEASDGTVPVTDPDGFTIEGDGGSLTFDRDDEESSVQFRGPDEEGRFSFDLDGDGIVTEGEGGSFELAGGEPPAWPEEFPVHEGSSVVRGSVLDAGELVQLSTTYRTEVEPPDVASFYRDELADLAPVVEEPAPGAADGPTTISFEGRWTGYVSISGTGEGTVVAVQLFSEPAPTPP